MCVGSPSNSTSPASNGKMPATHLIIVDLPAPLSPTSAVTSPARATRSTPRSACTAPKFLRRPHRRGSVAGPGRVRLRCVRSSWVRRFTPRRRGSVQVRDVVASRRIVTRTPGRGRPLARTGPAWSPGGGTTPASCVRRCRPRALGRVVGRADLLLRGVAVGDDVLDVVEVDRLGSSRTAATSLPDSVSSTEPVARSAVSSPLAAAMASAAAASASFLTAL